MPGRRLGELERRPAVGRDLHDVAVVLEQPAQDAVEARIVLDEQQVHGGQPTLGLRDDGDVAGRAADRRRGPLPGGRAAADVDAEREADHRPSTRRDIAGAGIGLGMVGRARFEGELDRSVRRRS